MKVKGIDYADLAKEYGTPLYVYDAEKIGSQVSLLRDAFEGVNLRLFYAVKALGNPAILRLMRSEGVGLDTVSLNEVRMGRAAGFGSGGEMIFTANAITFEELEEARELGVFVNIDSLDLLRQFGEKHGDSCACSIRINAHLLAETNERSKEWHLNSKFGISIDGWDQCLEIIRRFEIRVTGLHFHTSSQILDEALVGSAMDLALQLGEDIPSLNFIDLGGGISPRFHPEQVVPDIDRLGDIVRKKLAEAARGDLQIHLEPGRFLVSEAGVLLTKVAMRKPGRRHDFVGVDTGFHHLIRPAMYDAWHTIENLSNPGGELRRYSVVGNLCETDFLARDREMPVTQEGDLLAIRNAGAYGFSMASQYNHRPRPAELLIHQGQAHLIRRREVLEDFQATVVEMPDGFFAGS